jgi:hypothetical protein
MDLKLAFILSSLLATSIAQQYSCAAPNNCNKATFGPDRGAVLGCMYFCNVDNDANNELVRAEFDAAFNTCAGSGSTCDLAVFVPLMKAIIPICDTEAVGIYDDWAGRDGQAGFTLSDVDVLWNAALAAQGGGDVVLPAGFSGLWSEMWPRVQDPSCDLAYP